MKAFIISIVIVLLLLAAGYWFAGRHPEQVPEELHKAMALDLDDTPPARGPQDYHILEDQGGIPGAEALRAGLVGNGYAYLCALSTLRQDPGIEATSSLRVDGKLFDQGFRFTSTLPQDQVLEYNLQGDWDTLTFGFGFSDDEASDPTGQHAIELIVQADGMEIFGPQRFTPVDPPVFTELAVKDVRHLTFISRRVGVQNMFTPLLLDPFVKKLPPAEAGSSTK